MAPFIEANLVLYSQFYLDSDQSHQACFYYPLPNENYVTLRGQCDITIPVETDFEIDEVRANYSWEQYIRFCALNYISIIIPQYSGRWYLTERYPRREFERGNCSGVQYTVRDNTEDPVHVLDWEVLGGELDVIEGNLTALPSQCNDARFTLLLPSRSPEVQGEGK